MTDAAKIIEQTLEDTKEIVKERQSIVTYLCWALLLGALAFGIFTQSWNMVFLAVMVFILTMLPFFFQSVVHIKLPIGFVGGIVFFMVGTIFLGEAGDFYERFWWWDAFLHTFSAVGFGLTGVIIVLFLVRGDQISASPPSMLVLMAFSFAVSIGAVWEVFEFGMDQIFGTNMQKNGLMDTMYDLIVDIIGAAMGAMAGYIFLKSRRRGRGLLSNTIEKVIEENPEHFEEK
ncbi:hypothetical protein [Robiginitomaculum antarcticum]|uniref:hypothetical protein n=1 Tax=Robiginitomaculum antarcticum TaxID=437507 RepID=UPI000373D175|nr:hypothetical protein [Robiginitomaculum antarcticum]